MPKPSVRANKRDVATKGTPHYASVTGCGEWDVCFKENWEEDDFLNYISVSKMEYGETVNTFIAGDPVCTLKVIFGPVSEDEHEGINKGVNRPFYRGRCWPTTGSANVFVEGEPVVRWHDATMQNEGNATGKIIDQAELDAIMAEYAARGDNDDDDADGDGGLVDIVDDGGGTGPGDEDALVGPPAPPPAVDTNADCLLGEVEVFHDHKDGSTAAGAKRVPSSAGQLDMIEGRDLTFKAEVHKRHSMKHPLFTFSYGNALKTKGVKTKTRYEGTGPHTHKMALDRFDQLKKLGEKTTQIAAIESQFNAVDKAAAEKAGDKSFKESKGLKNISTLVKAIRLIVGSTGHAWSMEVEACHGDKPSFHGKVYPSDKVDQEIPLPEKLTKWLEGFENNLKKKVGADEGGKRHGTRSVGDKGGRLGKKKIKSGKFGSITTGFEFLKGSVKLEVHWKENPDYQVFLRLACVAELLLIKVEITWEIPLSTIAGWIKHPVVLGIMLVLLVAETNEIFKLAFFITVSGELKISGQVAKEAPGWQGSSANLEIKLTGGLSAMLGVYVASGPGDLVFASCDISTSITAEGGLGFGAGVQDFMAFFLGPLTLQPLIGALTVGTTSAVVANAVNTMGDLGELRDKVEKSEDWDVALSHMADTAGDMYDDVTGWISDWWNDEDDTKIKSGLFRPITIGKYAGKGWGFEKKIEFIKDPVILADKKEFNPF